MKKLVVILIVILLGIFLLNATRTSALEKTDMTLALMVDYFNTQFAKLTETEKDRVSSILPQKDFTDGSTFINQFASFCRVISAMDSVLAER